MRDRIARSLLLWVAVAACDGQDDLVLPPDPSEQVAVPDDCSTSVLALEVDGLDQEVDPVSSSSVIYQTALSDPLVVGDPSHLLTFGLGDPALLAAHIVLPDEGIQIDYQRLANGGPGATLVVTTGPALPINWITAEPSGSMAFRSIGTEVGEQRCAAFDLGLSWTAADGEHLIRAAGVFAGRVDEIITDGR